MRASAGAGDGASVWSVPSRTGRAWVRGSDRWVWEGVNKKLAAPPPAASGGQGVSRSCRVRSAIQCRSADSSTPEIMTAWGEWFESVADKPADIGFPGGAREISPDGSKDLAMGIDSITGFSIINAENLEEAEALARGEPVHREHSGDEIVE